MSSSLRAYPPGASAIGHRADVEALRALAVCVVLVFHALPWALPGGFLGVDVFFVVSGGYYRLNSGSDKGLSLGRFHGRLPAFG